MSVCIYVYIFLYRLFSTKGYNNVWHRSGSCMAQQLRGATPCPRSGAVAALCWSSHEEIFHVQGKKNPSKTVGAERGHQRADRLKLQSQTTNQSDHTDHSLVSLSETEPCHVEPPKTHGSWWRGLTDVFHWRRE